MAEPTAFDGDNCTLDKPQDMSSDECVSLSVLKWKTSSGEPLVTSCWKLTQEELNEINRTGRIWLTIYGVTMPPACVDGVQPFERVT